MRRRNHQKKSADTSKKKKSDSQFGFSFHDPSSSRAHSDLKRKRNVTFVDRSPLNDSHEAHTAVDAKTSEFAFFKKLKSDFGLCSQSSDSKSSNRVERNPKTVESAGGRGDNGTNRETRDGCKSYSFSTPTRRGSFMSPDNLTRKDIKKDPVKSSSAARRDKDTLQSGNNLRSGGFSDEKGDIFTVKRKKLHQWVKATWFPETPELNSDGQSLVSILLSRLLPSTNETYPSKFSKETADRVKRKPFLESPDSKFLKRSHANNSEFDYGVQTRKDRSISWQGWPESSITPSLQFSTGHVYSSLIPRAPEESSFPISCPYGSMYRPQFWKQKAALPFPVEETLDSSPMSSFDFRNYVPLSLGYHREDSRYGSENLSNDLALLLEWNIENAGTRKADESLPSYHTKLITYTNASSSSLTDNPWSSEYSSSHDLVTRELCPLPLLSHDTSDSFFLPTTNQPSHFEDELERHIIDEEDVVAGNQNLQRFHQTNRDGTHYDNPFQVPGCEIVSFPFSNLLEAPNRDGHWIPFKFQSSPQAWIDS